MYIIMCSFKTAEIDLCVGHYRGNGRSVREKLQLMWKECGNIYITKWQYCTMVIYFSLEVGCVLIKVRIILLWLCLKKLDWFGSARRRHYGGSCQKYYLISSAKLPLSGLFQL